MASVGQTHLYAGEEQKARLDADERTSCMSTAKRTTMSKMNRERELKEKRQLKQERKAEKKHAAAAAAAIEAELPAADDTPPPSE
jgi:hypothetical protein